MIIAFTGDGISKESRIETFQDRANIRTKLTRSFANTNPEEYRKVTRGKEPNDAQGANVVEVQDNASTKVRQFLERRKRELGY